MCHELKINGAGDIVVTGLEKGDELGNAIYLKDNDSFSVIYDKKILPLRPGTGDVFASIVAGGSIQNMNLSESVHKAMNFICTCLEKSSEHNIPINDGVCFEEYLYLLHQN